MVSWDFESHYSPLAREIPLLLQGDYNTRGKNLHIGEEGMRGAVLVFSGALGTNIL
jgi:hypothetical protein